MTGSGKKKIGIIGLGMIGGSLALALNGAYDVIGFDTDESTREYAIFRGFCRVVDVEEMRGAEAVFVCVPIAATADVLYSLSDKLSDTIVTDVASVKLPFAATRGRYVGGHPMAGTEKGGIAAAKPHLFQNAYWVITADGDDAVIVENIVKSTGARPLRMTAEDHDRAVAAYSHVPHAVAYALTSAAVSGVSPIAGSGFLDTTRIAKSDGEFWADVMLMNAKNVLRGVSSVSAELDALSGLIERGDRRALIDYLTAARKKRVALDCIDLGGEALYVDLVDRQGEFERVLGAVARAGIDVRNIALVPGREGVSGALRLEFATANDRERARAVLGEEGTWQE